ncbi:Uncharacterised protein [uncultured archaeon]|nr:Uncharacterised protein [uncultured archaeon]
MGKIRVVINRESNTLDVWFDDPEKEFISEETGEEIILKKDKNKRVIGFEKLNLLPSEENVPIEILTT